MTQYMDNSSRAKLILDASPNLILVSDGNKIIDGNQTFLDFFGYEKVEDFLKDYDCICDLFLQQDGRDYLEKKDSNGTIWATKVLENKWHKHHKALIKDKNGAEHIFEVSGKSLKDPNSDTVEVVMVFNDITHIEAQAQLMENMEMPILDISNDIFMIPMIGIIDSIKSQKLMENILENIQIKESKVVVVDISGITTIDSAVAAHLIKITKATKLMGCNSIVSGVSPAIAQTIVNLGIDIAHIETTANLKSALTVAFKFCKFELSKID